MGTKFKCPQTKPSPDGYSHFEHQFLFVLCTSPPSYQSIKKRSRSIPITLLRIWVGTRFVTPKGKNMSPEGYSHAERQIFFHSAHLLIHANLLKKKVSRYLRRFSNFGWGHDLWHQQQQRASDASLHHDNLPDESMQPACSRVRSGHSNRNDECHNICGLQSKSVFDGGCRAVGSSIPSSSSRQKEKPYTNPGCVVCLEEDIF